MATRLQELQSHPLGGNVPETAIMLVKDNTTALYYEDYKITFQDFTSKLIRKTEVSQEPIVGQIPRLIAGADGTTPALPEMSAEYLLNVESRVPVGTDAVYGKLKLSASISSTNGVTNGYAATPSAVKATYDAAAKKANNETISGTWTFTGAPTISNNLTVKSPTASTTIAIDTIANASGALRWRQDGYARWIMYKSSDEETGSNTGSNFTFSAYSDGGDALGVFSVSRSSQILNFSKVPTTSAAQGGGGSELTRKDYVDGIKTSLTNSKVNKAGDTMTGKLTVNPSTTGHSCLTIINKPNTTDTNAIGLDIFNSDGSSRVGGVGAFYNLGALQYAYVGGGAAPWDDGIKFYSDRTVISRDPRSEVAQGTTAASLTRKDYVDSIKTTLTNDKVAKAGDTMAGKLSINYGSSTTPGLYVGGLTHKAVIGVSSETNEALFGVATDDNTGFLSYIRVSPTATKLTFSPDSVTQYEIFHAGNKPTAADVGALPLTGGTLTGNVTAPKFIMTAAQGTGAGDAVRYDFTLNSIPIRASKIPDESDLNTYTTPGFYYQNADAGAASGENYPIHTAGSLEVLFGNFGGVVQRYTTYLSGVVYVRGCTSGLVWGSWRKQYGEGSKPTPADIGAVNKAGDTMTGKLTVDVDGEAIRLVAGATQPSYILGNVNGVNNWYVGKGSSSNDDIVLNSYVHANSVTLKSDHIALAKDPRTGAAQGTNAASLTRKDYVDGTFLKLSGGTLTGELITSGKSIRINNASLSAQFEAITGDYKTVMRPSGAYALFGNKVISTDTWAGVLKVALNGIVYNNSADAGVANDKFVYHQGFKPTASDVGALPITGGTLTGAVSGIAPTADAHLATKAYVDANSGGGGGGPITAAEGNSDIVAGGYGQVGTYGLMSQAQSSGWFNVGNTTAGNTIQYSAADGMGGESSTGTWKCLGYSEDTEYGMGAETTTLWIRIV